MKREIKEYLKKMAVLQLVKHVKDPKERNKRIHQVLKIIEK